MIPTEPAEVVLSNITGRTGEEPNTITPNAAPSDSKITGRTIEEPNTITPNAAPSDSKITGRTIEKIITYVIVTAVMAFLFANLRPWLWFLDTIPTGGDLAAHVWSPAYLRDVLLADLRLTGWTHDWYAGFPAFTFYMVIPSLLVVIVEAGLSLPIDFFAHIAAAGAVALIAWRGSIRWQVRARRFAVTSSTALALIAMQILNRLDGHAVGLFGRGDFIHNDLATDHFAAAVVLPVVVGLLVWKLLSASHNSSHNRNTDSDNPNHSNTNSDNSNHSDSDSPNHSNSDHNSDSSNHTNTDSDKQNHTNIDHNSPPRSNLRLPLTVAAVTLALVVTPIPYSIAFKLVAIAGIITLPLAAYVMTKFSGMGFPAPALASVATLPLIFDRSFNIYGGNLMSTMAGEFAYSLSLIGALLYIGVASQGMRKGRHQVLAGVLLALTALTHLFTALFALAATGALSIRLPWESKSNRLWLRWTAVTGALAAALSAWWVLPFLWNLGFLNDMGWKKETKFESALWSRASLDSNFLTNDPPLQVFVVLAAVGVVVCYFRRVRLPITLGATAAIFAALFLVLPEGRLWNGRLLPFYYFSVYLTALLGLGEMIRAAVPAIQKVGAAVNAVIKRLYEVIITGTSTVADPTTQASRAIATGRGLVGAVAAIAVIVMVGLPLRGLPFGQLNPTGAYEWGPFQTRQTNLGPSWVQYNYEGYPLKRATSDGGGATEYQDLVTTMGTVGEDYGCGTSLWEYHNKRLGSYGSPMSPMLFPYWTDRCIGSMEGLYFEASATTPFHFLMQSELSLAPSRAQRDLPYSYLDVATGVQHLRLMGIRYYLTSTDDATNQALGVPGLQEIATSGPWTVFLVEDSNPVVGLTQLPVVVEDLPATGEGWLEASVGAFLAGEPVIFLTTDGPDNWPRTTFDSIAEELEIARAHESRTYEDEHPRVRAMRRYSELLPSVVPREPVIRPATVSNVERHDQSVSFSVDRVGVPVLVRTSYFPNWSVSGADGPYRVSPNLIVVVPTDPNVRLVYDRSSVEWLSLCLTLAGIIAATWLAWRWRSSMHDKSLANNGDLLVTSSSSPSEEPATDSSTLSTDSSTLSTDSSLASPSTAPTDSTPDSTPAAPDSSPASPTSPSTASPVSSDSTNHSTGVL